MACCDAYEDMRNEYDAALKNGFYQVILPSGKVWGCENDDYDYMCRRFHTEDSGWSSAVRAFGNRLFDKEDLARKGFIVRYLKQ